MGVQPANPAAYVTGGYRLPPVAPIEHPAVVGVGRVPAVPAVDQPPLVYAQPGSRGARGGYARPPANVQHPPAPDFLAGGFGVGAAARQGAGSTYGAGLVNLPGSYILLLGQQSAFSANHLVKLPTTSRTYLISRSTTLTAVNAIFFCRYTSVITVFLYAELLLQSSKTFRMLTFRMLEEATSTWTLLGMPTPLAIPTLVQVRPITIVWCPVLR